MAHSLTAGKNLGKWTPGSFYGSVETWRKGIRVALSNALEKGVKVDIDSMDVSRPLGKCFFCRTENWRWRTLFC